MAHDLLSSADESTTGNLPTAETSDSSSPATQDAEDAGAQYADHEMDQLLEDIDFRICCLLELSPSIQRCTEHDDAEFISLSAVPGLSFERPQHAPETRKTLRILEETYPKAPKDLLDRVYKAKTRGHSAFSLCTFDECQTRYRIFEGAQWGHHEFSQHRFNRAWTCHICQRVDLNGSDWLGHLLAAHLIELEGSEMVLASKLACQVHPRPIEQEKCAFCGDYPAKTREEFEKHVGEHFQDAFELIAAYPMEHTEPQSSRNAAQPQSPTKKMDMSLDDPLEGFRSSRDVFNPDPLARVRIFSPGYIGDSTSIGSVSQPVMPNLLLNTGSQFNFSTSSIVLPPPNTARWRCGNCRDRPLMTIDNEIHCSNCSRRYDADSDYYDRNHMRIKI